MNPMKLESLVFQVHHPPVIPKVKLGDGRLGRLRWFHRGPNLQARGLWMSTRCTSYKVGSHITPKKMAEHFHGLCRVWLLNFHPDSEVDVMAHPMYHGFSGPHLSQGKT